MGIKGLKPNASSGFKQGYFTPLNIEKYQGKQPIIYRSSWERKFMEYCDQHPQIQYWSSESVEIKYLNPLDQKVHRYYPDFILKAIQNDDTVKTIIVEIKPESQLSPPTQPKRKTLKTINNFKKAYQTFMINQAKFSAAKQFCSTNNMKFMIVTENWINDHNL